jgi:capsular polysaccharide biosynthesis protein
VTKYRAFEILFRNKLLILLPLAVMLCATTAVAVRPQPMRWQSFAAVWVDPYKPLTTDDRLSTAASQALLINDFIHTRAFAISVLKQTQLAPLLDNPATQLSVVGQFQSWTHTAASGSFVTISATTPDPELSLKLAQAVVTSFQDILQGQSDNQAQAALDVYGTALKQAQDALTQSQSDLAAYLAAHPELARAGPDAAGRIALDPTYANLLNAVSVNQSNYNSLQQRLTNIQETAAAGRQGLPFTFTLVDEPQRPIYPVRASRLNRIKLPAIGLVVGLTLSGALAALLVLSNRAALGAPDIEAMFNQPVLGEIRPLHGDWWPFQRRHRSSRATWWPWGRKPRDIVRLRLATAARLRTHEHLDA